MARKQLNVRLPESHIERLNSMREDLSQSELIMRLIDEEFARRQERERLQTLTKNE